MEKNQQSLIATTPTRVLKNTFSFYQKVFFALNLMVMLFSSAYAQTLPTRNVTTPMTVGTAPFTAGNLTVGTSLTGVSGAGNVTSATTTDFASVTGLLGAWIELDYTDGPFPANTEVGFVVNKGLLSLGLLNGISITTYSDVNPPDQVLPLPAVLDGTVVENVSQTSLLGAGLATGVEKITFVAAQPFRRVRLTFSGLNLGGLISAVEVYRAEVMVPQPGVLASCNTQFSLTQNGFPAVAAYGATGVVGTGAVLSAGILGVLNTITDLQNIVSPSTTDRATVSPINASVAGAGYVSVKLTEGDILQNHFVGFDIENTASILSADLLNGLTVQALNSTGVVQSAGGNSLLSASVLVAGSRQVLGFVYTGADPINEIRLVFSSGLLSANAAVLGTTYIYGAVAKSFCAPTGTLSDYTILANDHPTAQGMGVTVNASSSGAATAQVLGSEQELEKLINSDPDDFVEIGSTLGVSALNPASIGVGTPGNTFPGARFAGFVVSGTAPLADVGLLTGVTISTYNNGALVESNSAGNPLRLNVLDLVEVNETGTDPQVLFIEASQPFDEVRITVNGLAGVGDVLRLHRAFVTTDLTLPVTFGPINAAIKNGMLSVNWTTISEENNREFVIEGSVDGVNWTKLGTVLSKAEGGSSDLPIEYNFSMSAGELMVMGGVSIVAAILLMLLALAMVPTLRKRKAICFVPVLAFIICATAVSCRKSSDTVDPDDQKVAFIRIGQTDIDGTTSYSKAVKITRQ